MVYFSNNQSKCVRDDGSQICHTLFGHADSLHNQDLLLARCRIGLFLVHIMFSFIVFLNLSVSFSTPSSITNFFKIEVQNNVGYMGRAKFCIAVKSLKLIFMCYFVFF